MKIARFALLGMALISFLFSSASTCFSQEEASDEQIEMVIGSLGEEDVEMRGLFLDMVRTDVKGEKATKAFAEHLPKLKSDAQVSLLSALADRGDPAAVPAVVELMKSTDDESVRLAAINFLGFLGKADDVAQLVKFYVEGSEAEKQAARESLLRIPGEAAAAKISAEMMKADKPVRISLIELLTERRALNTTPDLLKSAVDDDAYVRYAAMQALAQLAGPEDIPGMVDSAIKAYPGRECDAAGKAIAQVCARIEDADKQADPLIAVYEKLSDEDKKTVLPILGRVGGPDVLKIVEEAIASKDSGMHALGIRAICNWPDATIAPRLMELAKSDEHESHQTTALRSLIRVAPLRDDRTDAERLELLKQAIEMATRDDEKKLAIDRARNVLDIEALRFIVPYLDDPKFAQTACLSVVELSHHREVRTASDETKAEFAAALDKVIELSKDEMLIERAKLYKQDKTWYRPKKEKAKLVLEPPKGAKKPAESEQPEAKAPQVPISLIIIAVVILLLSVVLALIRKKA